jgi:type VI secretion system secreted protein VgrG
MGSMVLPTQAYTVRVPAQPAPFSVFEFSGAEAVSDLYRYEIEFTSPKSGIPMEEVLGKPAKFVIEPIDPNAEYLKRMLGEAAERLGAKMPARIVHGIVTEFDEFSTSADETHYRILLEPRLSDLSREVTSRLFQNQSVPAIIEAVLRHFGFTAADFKFKLRANYQNREYVTQYQETTLAFIQRLAADEGIWFRFEQTEDREIIVFGDDLDAYARNQRMAPLTRDAGLESAGAEAVKTLKRRRKRVVEAVRLNEYNHRTAGVSLLVEKNAARGDETTGGVDYRWGEHYATPEEGQRVAQLRHEALLAEQLVFEGEGNVFGLTAGEVFRFSDRKLDDAEHGIFITSVEHHASRKAAYSNTFRAIPSDRVFRPQIDPKAWPNIGGNLPARVASPDKYQYAYLTPEGWYRIQLPFDLDTWSPGGTSRPVRMAKPYAGEDYGHHFPLIDGTEVLIQFTAGDPDRPIIVGAMHDSRHPDLVNNLNNTRNRIVTAGGTEWRVEDKRGFEHSHLTTPLQTSELNLGHMVDADRKERGQGAELRTDGHVALRGAKGMLLSADAKYNAQGKQLDMEPARALLDRALEQMQGLAELAKSANAIAADYEAQKSLLNETLGGLRRAGILISAPDGVGIVSGTHIQVSAAGNLIATAGGSADIGVIKRFTVAAGEAISMVAQKFGMKLFAAKGKVEIQAQSDEMLLAALKDLMVTSTEGRLVLSAAKEVWIGSGGSYIKINGSGIENGTPGSIQEKCASWNKPGPASMQPVLPLLPKSICVPCLLAEFSQGALLGTK